MRQDLSNSPPASRSALNLARIILAVALVWPGATRAASATQEAVLELDPANTRIGFILPGSLHDTHGTFKLKLGTIRIDPVSGKAGGSVVVEAASGDSGNSLRDANMKGQVLEAQRYPEITFTPQQAQRIGGTKDEFQARVQGVIGLHGAEHQLTIDVQVGVSGAEVTATSHFVIPYAQWRLTNPSVLFLKVADTVNIEVTAAGHVTWVAAEKSAPDRH